MYGLKMSFEEGIEIEVWISTENERNKLLSAILTLRNILIPS